MNFFDHGTGEPFVTCVTTSPTSPALLRTFTWLAETTAGPETSGTVFNSGAFFFEAVAVDFFVVVFFLAVVVFFGVVVVVVVGMFVTSTGGVTIGIADMEFVAGVGSGGGAESTGAELDASCANTLVERAAAKMIQRFFFINLPK